MDKFLKNKVLKDNLLCTEVEHIDIKSFDARPIVSAMDNMSFSSRDLAKATNIYNKMLSDKDCLIILTLAGSTSAGGCMHIYSELLKNNMIDCVVATGASIVDMDFFEGLGFKHYKAENVIDDEQLRELNIDRIYDTYINEDDLKHCDMVIKNIADSLPAGIYSSRKFIQKMGKYLFEKDIGSNSLVRIAYEKEVPIFCPAFSDSSAGFGLVKHQVDKLENSEAYISIDSVADFRELTQIKIKNDESGLLMVGGGVPKNFAQDIVVCAEIIGSESINMHKYAVQITVADVRDGACSSSSLKEACSWGKVSPVEEQMLYAEATTVLPLLASSAFHSGLWKSRPERRCSRLFQN